MTAARPLTRPINACRDPLKATEKNHRCAVDKRRYSRDGSSQDGKKRDREETPSLHAIELFRSIKLGSSTRPRFNEREFRMFSNISNSAGDRGELARERVNELSIDHRISRPIVPLVNTEFAISYSAGARTYARARAYAVCAFRIRTGESFLCDIKRDKGQPQHTAHRVVRFLVQGA